MHAPRRGYLPFPTVDSHDPQWYKDPVSGDLRWTSCFVLREDWGGNTFYRSGIQFQKHLNREVRMLDLKPGRNYVNNKTAKINRTADYHFVNGSRSSKIADIRRRAQSTDARGSG